MSTQEERIEKIKTAFFEYAAHDTLSAFNTPGYYARRILPGKSFFLKANVIQDLIITITVQSVTLRKNVHLRHYIDTSKTLLYL
jgi:hypothetical protein